MDPDKEEDTKCGLWRWKPEFLQKFATAKSFMLVSGFLGMVQSMCFIYFVVTLTTMERRFKIPSKVSGIMMSGNDVSQIMLSLFLSYYGGQRNRPKWLAWGVFFSALSCFILALPHLIFGPGEDTLSLTEEYNNVYENLTIAERNKNLKICTLGNEEGGENDTCSANSQLTSTTIIPVTLVFISQFILGIGTSLLFSLGNTYMDDNTKKDNTPLFLGYQMGLRSLGPVIGYLLGPVFLSIFITPSLSPLISKEDPRWMGAYWLGWIFLGTLMFLFTFLIGMFPKTLPKKKIIYSRPFVESSFVEETLTAQECPLIIEGRMKRRNQQVKPNIVEKPPMLKELPAALKRIFTNKLFMCNITSGLFYINGAIAYIIYLAKYIEVQYNASSVTSSAVTGPLAILGMLLGFLISGWYISKRKPIPRNLLFWNLIVALIQIGGQLSFVFLSCPQTSLEKEISEVGKTLLINDCNNNCHCENIQYDPVCHRPTSQIYFSPCHAGCDTAFPQNQTFTNCKCIIGNMTSIDDINLNTTEEDWNTVHAGPCVHHCYKQHLIFTIVSVIVAVFGSSAKISNILINYRSVEVRDKSFAQGLLLVLASLLALIPGPILYGAIIDATCIQWGETCDRRSNCLLYDKDAFRIYINITSLSFLTMGFFFDIAVWFLAKDVNLYEESEQVLVAKAPAKPPRRDYFNRESTSY